MEAQMNQPVISNLSYSNALASMKGGDRVARKGWNGKDMYVFLCKGVPSFEYVVRNSMRSVRPDAADPEARHFAVRVELEPFLCMRTADGKFVPWLCSQTDALAQDWELLA